MHNIDCSLSHIDFCPGKFLSHLVVRCQKVIFITLKHPSPLTVESCCLILISRGSIHGHDRPPWLGLCTKYNQMSDNWGWAKLHWLHPCCETRYSIPIYWSLKANEPIMNSIDPMSIIINARVELTIDLSQHGRKLWDVRMGRAYFQIRLYWLTPMVRSGVKFPYQIGMIHARSNEAEWTDETSSLLSEVIVLSGWSRPLISCFKSGLVPSLPESTCPLMKSFPLAKIILPRLNSGCK